MIPKVFYAYWDGNPLSFLQYLTVKTFKDLNPEWQAVIYMPVKRFDKITWTTSEQKAPYTGKDYLDRLKQIAEIRLTDFEEIGFRNDISEVIKSDYLRYWILGTHGGLWSDMDIIYTSPIDKVFNPKLTCLGDSSNADTVICYFSNYYSVGFFMSKPNNPYFLDLVDNCNKLLNTNSYQSLGRHLLDRLYPRPQLIKDKFPELNVLLIDESTYLPYRWDAIPCIFTYNIPSKVTEFTVGIHWFNGADLSKDVQNLIDQHKFPITGSIYPYVKKYFEEEGLLTPI